MGGRITKLPTRAQICAAVSKEMRESYPETTEKVVDECLTAYLNGMRDDAMPHGIVGRFLQANFESLEDDGLLRKAAAT